jgi:hypothetical protein
MIDLLEERTWVQAIRFLGETIPSEKRENLASIRYNKLKTLFYLAKWAGKGTIVELGTLAGATAIMMAMGARHPVHTIDRREIPDLQKNLDATGFETHVVFHHGESQEIGKAWNTPIKWLHFDLDDDLMLNLSAWEQNVAADGLISIKYGAPPFEKYKPLGEWRIYKDFPLGCICLLKRYDPEMGWGDETGYDFTEIESTDELV